MRKKKLLNLSAIIIGALMCFGFNKVQAIDSVFDGTSITRNSLRSVATSNALTTSNTETILGISKIRESENYYSWGNNTTVDAKNVWKIAKYETTDPNDRNADYSNLYYCLNAERGFGVSEGRMAEGAKDTYTVEYEVNDTNKNNIISAAGGSLGANYNKVLWILDNSYIPTESSNLSQFKSSMNTKGVNIDALTEEQIEVVQQMAIWYYTNNSYEDPTNNRGELPNLYYNGTQTSSIVLNVDDYGEEITLYDELNDLYKYFINGADSYYTHKVPTLTLSNASATVTESGDYFVAGPFNLSGTNTELISEITATVTPNKTYKLLNSNNINDIVTGNNFKNVIGNNFYLRFNKSDITSDTTFDIKLDYKYNIRNLVVKTSSTPTSTQPVVLVQPGEKSKEIETNINIQLKGQYDLVLVKEDEKGEQLNSRATFEVNGISKTVTGRLTVADDVQITKQNVGTADVYTIKETVAPDDYCKFDGTITVTVTKKVENGKYVVDGVNYTVTNGNREDVNVYLKDGNIYVEVKDYPEEKPAKPDLALRKYITKIGSTDIANRIPQISDPNNNLNGDDAANHTAIYKHPKNVLEVKKGDMVEYSITIYNEGQVAARASKITDQIPAGLKFINVVSGNYELESYDETTNRLVLKETSANSDLGVFENINTIKSTTVVVKCEVLNSAEENKNLVNIAWISEMKKENETFTDDIDSQTTTSPECNKNSNEYTRPDNNGYFPGQQDDDDFDRIKVIPVEEGKLKIKLLKVDESNNKIESSEAKFDIKEGNNTENKTTTSGEIDLGQKTITGDNFEYTYTIKETQAPVGYELVNDELTVKVSGTTKKENNKYVIDSINIKDKDGNDLDNAKITADYDSSSNTVIIRVKDKRIENEYSVRLLKTNKDGTQALDNAWFKISTTNDLTNVQTNKISVSGETLTTGKLSNTNPISLTYYLKETQAPEGYIKDETLKEVKIKADVELNNGKYELRNVRLDPTVDGIELVEDNNVITIKVKNNPEVITGKYKVVVKKVDSTTEEVIPVSKGATFKINNRTYTLGEDEIENTNITSANDIRLQYTIEETQAPTGYDKIEGVKTAKGTLKIVKDGTSWKANRLENTEVDSNIEMTLDNNNTITITIKDSPIKKDFDLSLRKFITAVNKEELKKEDGTYTRAPIVDTTPLKNKTATTAIYKHTKFPVSVQKGDIVTYTIRVYNEGEVDGYVNKIADYLPNYLQPIISGLDGIDSTKYAEEIAFNTDRLWTLGENNKVETEITNKEKQSAVNMYGDAGLLLSKFNGGDTLDYIDVQIKCLVKDDKSLTTGTYLTNIAEIVDAEDINGEHWDGKDSALNGLKNGNPTDTSDLNNYKNAEALASNTNSYIEGQEDDDDFEKLVIESFDLSLRKFITAIGEDELKNADGTYKREPKVDTSKLGTEDENGNTITTATYTHPKDPITVKKGDIITYTLRVYNEGTLNGYATEVFDYIPEGLEFIDPSESSINRSNSWEMRDGKLVTTYLADKLIDAVTTNSEGKKELDFEDVKIQLKVTADPKTFTGDLITNWAEIGEDSNNDIDSTPGNEEKEEDDIDYEPVKLVYFDLALRKFITNANGIEYNNRIPEVDTSKLGTLDENGKKITTFTYRHTKEPVVVTTGSTVVYTIRVYNEGSISGYATEITDNIPEGLQFLPENEINKTDYKWKMLDAEGNVTEDVTKAKKITTSYLANQIIDAYQKGNGTEVISFKDVKVAFKVIEPNTSNRLVINTAEISKASDEDIDSTPGNDDLTEDDIDREYLKVKYFDLALKKWVTATKVIYNGKTKITKTGFNEDSTEIAKVDLVASKLKKTTVKFVYNIKVINEGEVAGYATEVEDYIPAGLKFVQEDNPKWKLVKDNVAVTDQLKDTLLEPGQTATIEIVLTWKNSSSNMGVKTNWAEIKEDSDDDIDSVPDNNKKEEDDIDNAKVILSIKTGSVRTYILLALTSVVILAGGTILIKKYVVK